MVGMVGTRGRIGCRPPGPNADTGSAPSGRGRIVAASSLRQASNTGIVGRSRRRAVPVLFLLPGFFFPLPHASVILAPGRRAHQDKLRVSAGGPAGRPRPRLAEAASLTPNGPP